MTVHVRNFCSGVADSHVINAYDRWYVYKVMWLAGSQVSGNDYAQNRYNGKDMGRYNDTTTYRKLDQT